MTSPNGGHGRGDGYLDSNVLFMSGSKSVFSEIPWIMSLSLIEVLRFGPSVWWWKLRWAFWQEFRDLDIVELLRDRPSEFDYGETPTATLARILEVADLPTGARFVDLGFGRGLTVLAAAFMGYRASGIEMLEDYVERSRRVASRSGLKVDLRSGDFLVDEWPDGELYLLNSTAFSDKTRGALETRLTELVLGTVVVTYDWSLDSTLFEEFESLRLPVTRGTVLCRFFRRRSVAL